MHKDHFSVHIFSGAVVLEDLPYSRVLSVEMTLGFLGVVLVSRHSFWLPVDPKTFSVSLNSSDGVLLAALIDVFPGRADVWLQGSVA